jgi:putative tricarboxylic transport membrane protein
MRKFHQIAAAVIVPAAVFFGYQASKLVYYTPIGPGPGFFPVWLCGLLALLGTVLFAQATFGSPEKRPADFFAERAGYADIGASLAAVLAAAALLEIAGFGPAMFVFYVALLLRFGRRKPVEIVVLAAAGSFGVEYVFSQLLSQPLPAGPFAW